MVELFVLPRRYLQRKKNLDDLMVKYGGEILAHEHRIFSSMIRNVNWNFREKMLTELFDGHLNVEAQKQLSNKPTAELNIREFTIGTKGPQDLIHMCDDTELCYALGLALKHYIQLLDEGSVSLGDVPYRQRPVIKAITNFMVRGDIEGKTAMEIKKLRLNHLIDAFSCFYTDWENKADGKASELMRHIVSSLPVDGSVNYDSCAVRIVIQTAIAFNRAKEDKPLENAETLGYLLRNVALCDRDFLEIFATSYSKVVNDLDDMMIGRIMVHFEIPKWETDSDETNTKQSQHKKRGSQSQSSSKKPEETIAKRRRLDPETVENQGSTQMSATSVEESQQQQQPQILHFYRLAEMLMNAYQILAHMNQSETSALDTMIESKSDSSDFHLLWYPYGIHSGATFPARCADALRIMGFPFPPHEIKKFQIHTDLFMPDDKANRAEKWHRLAIDHTSMKSGLEYDWVLKFAMGIWSNLEKHHVGATSHSNLPDSKLIQYFHAQFTTGLIDALYQKVSENPYSTLHGCFSEENLHTLGMQAVFQREPLPFLRTEFNIARKIFLKAFFEKMETTYPEKANHATVLIKILTAQELNPKTLCALIEEAGIYAKRTFEPLPGCPHFYRWIISMIFIPRKPKVLPKTEFMACVYCHAKVQGMPDILVISENLMPEAGDRIIDRMMDAIPIPKHECMCSIIGARAFINETEDPPLSILMKYSNSEFAVCPPLIECSMNMARNRNPAFWKMRAIIAVLTIKNPLINPAVRNSIANVLTRIANLGIKRLIGQAEGPQLNHPQNAAAILESMENAGLERLALGHITLFWQSFLDNLLENKHLTPALFEELKKHYVYQVRNTEKYGDNFDMPKV